MLHHSCPASRLGLLLGLASLLSAPLDSQTLTPGDNGRRVFQANARIVVLDVVVSGRNSRPVSGLDKKDFRVSEDGHPQTITYFEVHNGAQPLQANPPVLQPNIYTNIPRIEPSDSLTVLVLDSLNTPLDDQSHVRAQMLKYLKKLPTGRRMAIFMLGTQLRLLQGFTDDPALLTAALNNQKNGKQVSPLLQSNAEAAATQETVDALMVHAAEAATAMQQFSAQEDSTRSEVRLKLTLQALQQLAQYLSGMPGRKNVAWFSGGFPIVLLPNPDLPNAFGAQRDDQQEVHKTDALLASAQVAIYPIGAEGVGADTLYTAGADSRLTQQQLSRPGWGEAQQRNANHAAMDEIAKDTGGAAFYSTNNLADALDRVTAHGSYFYTLTYTSTNPATDGQFRKIQVQLANLPGYRLAYRRGYYADNANTVQAAAAKPAPPAADPLSPFLRPGLPESTQIPFVLHVLRGSAPARAAPGLVTSKQTTGNSGQGGDNPNLKGALARYKVDLMIASHSLQWDPAADGNRHYKVEAALVVYNRQGQPVNWLLRQINLNLDAAHYAIVQANGVNFYLEIDAPDDGVTLRGGVYDLNANLTGTLEIPLSSVVSPVPATSSR
jgi:VWFA-related protein